MQRQQKYNESYVLVLLRNYLSTIAFTIIFFEGLFNVNAAYARENMIRFGVPPAGWPPYIIIQQNQVTGMSIDIVTEIASRTGYEVKFITVPEKRAHLEIQQGELDAYIDAKKWVEKPELYLWSNPLSQSEDRLIVKNAPALVVNQIEDLFGKTVGTRLGFGYPTLERYFKGGQITKSDAKNESAILKMLSMGRTDAAVININVALWVIKNDADMQASDFIFTGERVDIADVRIMFTRKFDWTPFIKEFNDLLRTMKQDGQFDRIVSNYVNRK